MSQKMPRPGHFALKLCMLLTSSIAAAQDSLPFPPTPSASDAKPTLQESRHQKRQQQSQATQYHAAKNQGVPDTHSPLVGAD